MAFAVSEEVRERRGRRPAPARGRPADAAAAAGAGRPSLLARLVLRPPADAWTGSDQDAFDTAAGFLAVILLALTLIGGLAALLLLALF